MDIAGSVLGEKVAWPQIAFMSAYPTDVRNGYLLFVAAILTVMLLSSCVFASIFGASPGKMSVGLAFADSNGARASAINVWKRGLLLVGLATLILLPGPILGFLFGPSADPYSLISLFLAFVVTVYACFGYGSASDSVLLINRMAGTRLTRVSELKKD